MRKSVCYVIFALVVLLCGIVCLPAVAMAEEKTYVEPEGRFSFAYDAAYSVQWDDQSGATVYTENDGYIPFVLVWLMHKGDTTGFDVGEFFDQYTLDMQSDYGSSLQSAEEGLSLQLGGVSLPGARYTYDVSGHMVELMVFVHDTGDSLRQYSAKYIQGQGDATLAAMAKAIGSFQLLGQPKANTSASDGTSPSQPTEPNVAATTANPLRLVDVDGGFFSLKLPEGWKYATMGMYTSFGFRAWDPQNDDYQIFYYGSLTPLLKSEAAKEWNRKASQMVQAGSTYHLFADAPAVNINDVSTLFYAWPQLTSLVERYGGTWMQTGFSFPGLRNFAVIDRIPFQSLLSGVASDEAIVTASFQSDQSTNCFGKFSASLVPMQSYVVDGIDLSLATALSVTGVMAPQNDFLNVEQALSQAAYSLTFTEEYVREANAAVQQSTSEFLDMMKDVQDVYDRYNAAWISYIRGNTLLYIDADGTHVY